MHSPIRYLTPRRIALFAVAETLVAAALVGAIAVIYPPALGTMVLLLVAMLAITILLMVTGT